MDHMRISGTEPSSVILSQTCSIKSKKVMTKRTSESPRAHVAKFYGRLRLIRSVWRASKFSVFKIDSNCDFVGLRVVLHHPFWLQLVLAP